MDLISVIVPVYRAEAYLDRCVESIVKQTYKNLEIFLVDDGSPDGSGQLCDRWAEQDKRICVIHQTNTGSAQARNVAIDLAQGAYIAFVDSDDYLSEDMYEHLHDLLQQGADIAECAHMDVWDDHAAFDSAEAPVRTYTPAEAMAEHIRDRIFRQMPVNKLYRRDTLGDIRFPVGKSIDDEFFTYRVLSRARSLIRSEKICYAYRQHSASAMHSMSSQKRLQAVEAKVQRYHHIRDTFPQLEGLCLKDLWFTCMYHGQRSLKEKNASKQALPYLSSILKAHPCKYSGCNGTERLWLMLARLSFRAVCNLRNALNIGV